MTRYRQQWPAALVILLASAGLPLLGAWWSGRPLAPLFEFPPPLEIPRDYPRFSWIAAGLVLALLAAITANWVRKIRTVALGADPGISPKDDSSAAARPGRGRLRGPTAISSTRLPTWGWLAFAWIGVWWTLAWTRFPWFAPLQLYTFFPLWLGFIVAVNALTTKRSGTCLMLRARHPWLALFAASAGFWWLFEWLNRFVRNWHYLGVEEFGPAGYAIHATICFSTVLPAVAAVREFLATFPRWNEALAAGPAWTWLDRRTTGIVLAGVGLASLFGTGLRPNFFYPALWLAPLLLATAIGLVGSRAGWWTGAAAGDWRQAGSWAAAALICGFCWELWNFPSLAKWIYTVPYVDRWHVFEMPLLGYAGYLSFGLECQIVCAWILPQFRGIVEK